MMVTTLCHLAAGEDLATEAESISSPPQSLPQQAAQTRVPGVSPGGKSQLPKGYCGLLWLDLFQIFSLNWNEGSGTWAYSGWPCRLLSPLSLISSLLACTSLETAKTLEIKSGTLPPKPENRKKWRQYSSTWIVCAPRFQGKKTY